MAIPAAKIEAVPRRQAAAPTIASPWSGLLRYKPHTLGEGRRKAAGHAEPRWPRPPIRSSASSTDADLKFGTVKNEKGELVELSNATFCIVPALARAQRPQEGVPSVLRAVRRPREHAGRDAGRLDAARRLLRQGPQLPECAGGLAVSRQRAGRGVRQPDRLGPPAPAGPVSLLRRAAAQDEAARHPPLRHLRADPQRARNASTPGTRPSKLVVESLEPLGSEYCGVLEEGLERPLVRPLPEPGQAERRVQLRLATTASRTS